MIRNSFIFLSGVGEKTERKLWDGGITDWARYHASDDQALPRRIRKHRELHERHLGLAQRALEQGDLGKFGRWLPNSETWRLYQEVAEHTLFLDIETTGLSYPAGRTTVVGGHIPEQGTELLVRGQGLCAQSIQEMLDRSRLIVTFNGSRFDLPFLKKEFGVQVDHVPHLDLRFALKKVGITGGLKRIERELGVGRDEAVAGMDGYEAVRLWKRWERGDESALDTLLTYNEEDVVNMLPLTEIAFEKLHKKTFGRYGLADRSGKTP